MFRRLLSLAYILVALALCLVFFRAIDFPVGIGPYFNFGFYQQFGAIAIGVEMLVAGIYLLTHHKKTNFAMALFGFTAVLDPILNYFGVFSTKVPLYGTILFLCFALVSFWIAFSNAFNTEKISVPTLLLAFVWGLIIDLIFNDL